MGGFVALEGEESPESTQAEGGNEDAAPAIPPEVLAELKRQQRHTRER